MKLVSYCCRATPVGQVNKDENTGMPKGKCRGCGRNVTFTTSSR